MKPDIDFYDLSQSAQGAFFNAAIAERKRRGEEIPPRPPILQLRSGYAESPHWMMIQALEFEPDPLTVQDIRVRAVWSSERIIAALLELLAGEQWLDRVDEAYHLTPAGREVIQGITARTAAALSKIEPLPLPDLEQLETYLRQVVEASLKSPKLPGTWSLEHSRRRAPAEEAHVMVKISAYCSDFNAFRDDCHNAAFQHTGVEGYMWESMTLIWRKEALTAEEAYEKLYYRGYSRREFAYAFATLVERGWIAVQNGRYHLTAEGEEVRETAERDTDTYFYAPWSAFSPTALTEFADLLTRLRDRAQALADLT